MKCTMLYQDPATKARGCPSVYLAETGELVVQGPEFAVGHAEPGTAPPGDAAVQVAADVLVRGLAGYRARKSDEPARTGNSAPAFGGGSSHATSTGHIVVRGPRLDADSLAGLMAVLDHETAVRVAPRVVIEAVERYQDSR